MVARTTRNWNAMKSRVNFVVLTVPLLCRRLFRFIEAQCLGELFNWMHSSATVIPVVKVYYAFCSWNGNETKTVFAQPLASLFVNNNYTFVRRNYARSFGFLLASWKSLTIAVRLPPKVLHNCYPSFCSKSLRSLLKPSIPAHSLNRLNSK